METKSLSYKEYDTFKVRLIGDNNDFNITTQERDKIIEALMSGKKYISLGNVFFAASALSSILPVSSVSGEVPLLPNKVIKHE